MPSEYFPPAHRLVLHPVFIREASYGGRWWLMHSPITGQSAKWKQQWSVLGEGTTVLYSLILKEYQGRGERM